MAFGSAERATMHEFFMKTTRKTGNTAVTGLADKPSLRHAG
ncbi:hypothetical protein [Asaia lannensis]